MHNQLVAARSTRTAAASERNRELGALRAIDDPAKLAKAARIVRLALERKRLTLADLGVTGRPNGTGEAA